MEQEDFATLSEYALAENSAEDSGVRIISSRIFRGRTYKYREEHGRFKATYAQKVTDSEAWEIVRKLSRHYKLGTIAVSFFGNRGSGRAKWTAWGTKEIVLSHSPSMGLIAHEVAHHLARKRHKNRKVRHGSKCWVRLVGRVIAYGDKRGWWAGEFARKRTRKTEALERRKEKEAQRDTPQVKIAQVRALIKRWGTKLKRAENAIRKLKKREKCLGGRTE